MWSCIHDSVKTITLTDAAYTRLREWKQSPDDSFSSIVLKLVPERGTLSQMLEDIGKLPPLSKRSARVMEESARWGREPTSHKEPWTS
jgi:predicted CopG family antitoxin